MRLILIIALVLMPVCITNAETYKWEDADGVHYTDNPNSVPLKFRITQEMPPATQSAGTDAVTPQKMRNDTYPHQMGYKPFPPPVTYTPSLPPVTTRAPQATIHRVPVRNVQPNPNVIKPLARFVTFWIMMAMAAAVVWFYTLLDIIKSEFKSPENKIVWILLVLGLGPIGIMLYFLVGRSQRVVQSGYMR